MKKIMDRSDIHIVAFIIMTISIFIIPKTTAQTRDTVHYNAKWEKTDRENQHFYRVIYRSGDEGPIHVQDYYPDGTMQMDGWYSTLDPETRDGEFTWWHEDGKKHRWMTFDKGELTKITEWDSKGNIIRQQETVTTVNYQDGERTYDKRTLEKAPVFNRGKSSFSDYAAKHLIYPSGSEGATGQVIVRFVVNKKGKTKDAKVVQSVNEVLDKAAFDFIKSLPRWTPGVLNGKKIKVEMELPVIFK